MSNHIRINITKAEEKKNLDIPLHNPHAKATMMPWNIDDICKRVFATGNSSAKIELNAACQRGVVYSDEWASNLIDSIWRCYYISPILLYKKGNRYICYDGKQRISAIVGFMNNKFPYVSETSKRRFFFSKIPDNKRGCYILTDDERSTFKELVPFQSAVCESKDLTEEDFTNMFQRIQKASPLKAGEKINAIGGLFVEYIRAQVEENQSKLEGLLGRDKRGQYLKIFCGMYVLVNNINVDMKKFIKINPDLPIENQQRELVSSVKNIKHTKLFESVMAECVAFVKRSEFLRGLGNKAHKSILFPLSYAISRHPQLEDSRLEAIVQKVVEKRAGVDRNASELEIDRPHLKQWRDLANLVIPSGSGRAETKQ